MDESELVELFLSMFGFTYHSNSTEQIFIFQYTAMEPATHTAYI